MKVIVAHPGKQHSYRTAEGLFANDMLFKYITTVYDCNSCLLSLCKVVLPNKIVDKIHRRKSKFLPDDCIELRCTLLGLFLLFFYKLPLNRKYKDRLFQFVHNQFGEKVAKYAIKHNVDAVIMYDTTCLKCFEILSKKAPHITRIQDVSIANRAFMKLNYENDIKIEGDARIKLEQSNLWKPNVLKRNEEEIFLSQYFFVASNMSKNSLALSNVDLSKVFIIPYGVEFEKFTFRKKRVTTGPLHLIYVGQISYRKGLHHLLKVVSEFNVSDVKLKLLGYYDTSNTIYQDYHNVSNIDFVGFVNHEELLKYYHAADVFVFPTLGEGFGLVVLEALSCGVPCIVSKLAGGNDAIVEGKNGFEINPSDNIDLKEKILWFLQNRNMLPEMSEYSAKSVLKYTWDNYYRGITESLNQIIKDESVD